MLTNWIAAAFLAAGSLAPTTTATTAAPPPVPSDYHLLPITLTYPGDGQAWVQATQVSDTGRYVVLSYFSRVDGGRPWQVARYDRVTGVVDKVSVSRHGGLANQDCTAVDVSADGRYVLFTSYASNLVPHDRNRAADAFVRDLQTGRTTLVSVVPPGVRVPRTDADAQALSADGHLAFFVAVAHHLRGLPGQSYEIYARDLSSGRTSLVSRHPDGTAFTRTANVAGVSDSGRFVALNTSAALAAGDHDGRPDVYLLDRRTSRTRWVSLPPPGVTFGADAESAGISGNGRVVAFDEGRTTRTESSWRPYLWDATTGRTTPAAPDAGGRDRQGHVSVPSGRGRVAVLVSAADLTNEEGAGAKRDLDTYVLERSGGGITRISGGVDETHRHHLVGLVSRDLSTVVFNTDVQLDPADTDDTEDVYVRELTW